MAETEQRSRTGVELEHVLIKAMEIVDHEGASALTMRRLAGELGIGVMTLYGHVRTKEELLDGVVDIAVRELEIPADGSWDDRLIALFTNLRALLVRHPSVLHADPLRPMTGPAALHAADAALGMLREGGLEGRNAVDAMSVLISYTFGSAMFRLDRSGERRAHYERNVRGADPAELPNVAELAEPFLDRGSDREFEVGLRVLAAGLIAHESPDLG